MTNTEINDIFNITAIMFYFHWDKFHQCAPHDLSDKGSSTNW